MEIFQFIIANLQIVIPALVSVCFLVVNIIQAIRCRNASKLKNAISRIPEILRAVEVLAAEWNWNDSTTTTITKSVYKKSAAESILKSEVGDRFYKKYIHVFDDAIEDILNTPQKKGGSNDGLSKENEERKG